MRNKYNNYDKYPNIKVDRDASSGYEELKQIILKKNPSVVVMDCYPQVDVQEIIDNVGELFDTVFVSDTAAYCGDELTTRIEKILTHDRIFGVMTTDRLEDYFISSKVSEMRNAINASKGRTLVIGVGALLIVNGDVNFHFAVARWESQMRFRKNVPNWNCDNYDMDNLTKFKRGYFFEWRLADKHKTENFNNFDFIVDLNIPLSPKIMKTEDYSHAMDIVASRPFRVVPYFDPGVWGGQWLKEACGLDKAQVNYAWGFDCVPEENSVLYDFNGIIVEMPAIDIVFHRAANLLGDRVQARFGNEFPIRFDFLDTMGGGNLSLQVHPTTEYIQDNFNMRYTQDESYYILDSGSEDASVYLGVKKDIKPDEFISALSDAQNTGKMNVEKYVNRFKAKKHDHFLIPGGTIHCSGANTMILEISSTPYIFTFKLWDWGRLGLDGKPRAINIEHGSKVIEYSRDTEWTKCNLVNKFSPINSTGSYTEEATGLHEREFIETRRHWFHGEVLHKANGSVNVLNLVEGIEAEVVSTNGEFLPFVVHYAETFIVPASVGDFIIRPTKKSQGSKLATIKAYVRG